MKRASMVLAFRGIAVAASFGLAAGWSTASARNQAILIGVSDYETKSITKLDAPGNDVKRVWDFLTGWKFDPKDIAVLSDDLTAFKGKPPERLQRPTAKNILDAIDGLTRQLASRPRDPNAFIVLYFSGHGSFHREDPNKKGSNAPELDGNDEVLLAIDAKNFDENKAGGPGIPGSILDDELGAKLEELRRHALVWLIINSCHAGGTTRSVLPEDIKYKATNPKDLGAPVSNGSVLGGGGLGGLVPAWTAAPSSEGIVQFLAVGKEEKAIERKMVVDGAEGAYSIFTHFLLEALRQPGLTTYRSLAEEVQRRIVKQSSANPTPVFQGPLEVSLPEVIQGGWSATWDGEKRSVAIKAGSLAGLRKGTVVALQRIVNGVPSIAGHARVTEATAIASSGEPIAYDEVAVPAPAALQQPGLLAKVVANADAFVLTISRPPVLDCDPKLPAAEAKPGLKSSARTKADLTKINEAIRLIEDEVRAKKAKTFPVEFVKPGAPALVQLCVSRDVVYLVGADAQLDTDERGGTPGHRITSDARQLAEKLSASLWKLLRQQNLLRIAGEPGTSSIGEKVTVNLKLERDLKALSEAPDKERRKCTNFDAAVQPDTATEMLPIGSARKPGEAPRAKKADNQVFTVFGTAITHCDRIIVEITNRFEKDVDVTLLYLDNRGSIGRLVDERREARIRRMSVGVPPEPTVFDVKIVTWCPTGKWDVCLEAKANAEKQKGKETAGTNHTLYAPIGIERLAVIVAEAAGPERTYYFLTQEGLDLAPERRSDAVARSAGGTRAGTDKFNSLLREAAMEGEARTRSVSPGGDATMKVFQWKVVPPAKLNQPRR